MICGCNDNHACFNPLKAACWWAGPDLCSHCADPDIFRLTKRPEINLKRIPEMTVGLLRTALKVALQKQIRVYIIKPEDATPGWGYIQVLGTEKQLEKVHKLIQAWFIGDFIVGTKVNSAYRLVASINLANTWTSKELAEL
jgi:hypothetical protein